MPWPMLNISRSPLRNVLLLSMGLVLTGCGTSPPEIIKPNLPEEPIGIKTCTDEAVPSLPGSPGTGWTTPEAVQIIGDQRTAAFSKDRCSHDWREFYKDLRDRLAK